MLPYSCTLWILHEQDAEQLEDHNTRRLTRLPLGVFRRSLPRAQFPPATHPGLSSLTPSPYFLMLPIPTPSRHATPFQPYFNAPTINLHRLRGSALAAYWKSPYRQCSGPPAPSFQLAAPGPEHCRYSPNDLSTGIRCMFHFQSLNPLDAHHQTGAPATPCFGSFGARY